MLPTCIQAHTLFGVNLHPFTAFWFSVSMLYLINAYIFFEIHYFPLRLLFHKNVFEIKTLSWKLNFSLYLNLRRNVLMFNDYCEWHPVIINCIHLYTFFLCFLDKDENKNGGMYSSKKYSKEIIATQPTSVSTTPTVNLHGSVQKRNPP